ncbi:hypothetical protein J6X15_01135 [Candidatus Saccharibacteria bacterium]|nr:hypothetical protein [Candidatus Saccharibacteria bacterium]MBP5656170.1 hypothetical protein [Candidatus Saccharibacteria bacterium]
MSEDMKNIATTTTDSTTAAPAAPSEVHAKLSEYGVDEAMIAKITDDLGATTIDDLASLEVSDLTGIGMKVAPARRLVNNLKSAAKPTTTPAVAAAETRAIQSQFEALLPSIPTDESWLNALKTGGVLKVDESSYIAAIRAALADRAGLYGIPAALSGAMEKYADETDEQVDPMFYTLRKSLTRRAYGDIFAAIDGLDGSFVTETRRKEFLSRVRNTLWPAIAESYRALDGWYQTWRASFSDPSMLIAAIGGGFSGGAAGMSMITPPDTAALHDAGDTLVDSINRVFRGTGVQIAAAMAYDANTIRNTLEDPRLPSMIGVKNREMMLKKIGANVSSNYVRLEQNLVKYVLGFAKHDTITSDVEVNYFVALWQLGSQINWSELGGASAGTTGLTGKNVL